MPEFPRIDTSVGASRVRFVKGKRVGFCVERKQFEGTLHVLSMTGGLARVNAPIPGTLAELSIETNFGVVRGRVELLPTRGEGISTMQPFRFLAFVNDEAERLRKLLQGVA